MHKWVRGAWVSLCMRWVGAWIGSLGRCACACACAYMRASAHWCACVHCIAVGWFVSRCIACEDAWMHGCVRGCVNASGGSVHPWVVSSFPACFLSCDCVCVLVTRRVWSSKIPRSVHSARRLVHYWMYARTDSRARTRTHKNTHKRACMHGRTDRHTRARTRAHAHARMRRAHMHHAPCTHARQFAWTQARLSTGCMPHTFFCPHACTHARWHLPANPPACMDIRDCQSVRMHARSQSAAACSNKTHACTFMHAHVRAHTKRAC